MGFLRGENALLKSQDLLKDLYQLPAYEKVVSGKQEQRVRSMQAESHALLREVATFSSRSLVVDLSGIQPGKSWQPTESKPQAQLAAKRAILEKLKAKVDKLAAEKRDLRL